jgi:hypothetical protein
VVGVVDGVDVGVEVGVGVGLGVFSIILIDWFLISQ